MAATWTFTWQAAGYGPAAVPAMTLFGTVGMFGLGILLTGELPRPEMVGIAATNSGFRSILLTRTP